MYARNRRGLLTPMVGCSVAPASNPPPQTLSNDRMDPATRQPFLGPTVASDQYVRSICASRLTFR